MARRRFEPTNDNRRLVVSMAACRIPEEKIAAVLGIDLKKLRKYFPSELDTSAIRATARVRQTLYEMATSGTSAAAIFFFLKTRAGWRERATNPGAVAHRPTEDLAGESERAGKYIARLISRRVEVARAQEREVNQGQGEAASESPAEGEDEGKCAA